MTTTQPKPRGNRLLTPEQVTELRVMHQPDAEGRRYTIQSLQEHCLRQWGIVIGYQAVRHAVNRMTYTDVGFDPQDAGQEA